MVSICTVDQILMREQEHHCTSVHVTRQAFEFVYDSCWSESHVVRSFAHFPIPIRFLIRNLSIENIRFYYYLSRKIWFQLNSSVALASNTPNCFRSNSWQTYINTQCHRIALASHQVSLHKRYRKKRHFKSERIQVQLFCPIKTKLYANWLTT